MLKMRKLLGLLMYRKTAMQLLIILFACNWIGFVQGETNQQPYLKPTTIAFCDNNVARFDDALAQLSSTYANTNDSWGPRLRNRINPYFTPCMVSTRSHWKQQRVLAAAALWINKKLNYCHHHQKTGSIMPCGTV